jgi:hypothetical protein
VDCFKHRNTVTLEVCLEALKERLHQHRQSIVSAVGQSVPPPVELTGFKVYHL